MNITGKLKILISEKKISVAELARQTDIPVVSLRTMLKRKDPNNYNVNTLIKIAKVLGTTVSYLTVDDQDRLPYINKKQINMLKKQISEEIQVFFQNP